MRLSRGYTICVHVYSPPGAFGIAGFGCDDGINVTRLSGNASFLKLTRCFSCTLSLERRPESANAVDVWARHAGSEVPALEREKSPGLDDAVLRILAVRHTLPRV